MSAELPVLVEPLRPGKSSRRALVEAERRTLLTVLLGTVFFVVLVRTAWLGDDAFITLRTVDNFVNGYGMRWNVVERVQTFTHPLWFFLCSAAYAVTREAYFTIYALSIGVSLVTFYLFLKFVSSSLTAALLGGTTLLLSKSFVDYSTSGLENPLSHLLVVLLLLAWWRVVNGVAGLTTLWLAAGLLTLNRLDLALLAAPALVIASRPSPWRVVTRAAAIGLTPLVAWELFSIVYYGVPFPNTAYAKLQTGIPSGVLFGQGVLYLLDAFAVDPVTPLAIGVSAALALNAARHEWPWVAGVALYTLYFVSVGGDFMSGRFLSVVVLLMVAVWARTSLPLPRGAAPIALATLTVIGVFGTARPPLTSSAWTFGDGPNAAIEVNGVADERAVYYRYTGLLRWSRARPLPWNAQVQRGLELRATPQVVVEPNPGFVGYYAGPGVTIVDPYGLGDAFLARLPADPEWRTGHYFRTPPAGYVDSVRLNSNLLEDRAQAALYERVRQVTRGPLWTMRRWRAIGALNFGGS